MAQAEARLEELRNGARPEDIAGASARVSGARAAVIEARASYQRAKQLLQQKLAAQATLDRPWPIATQPRPLCSLPRKNYCA